jgi:hypothetical protein
MFELYLALGIMGLLYYGKNKNSAIQNSSLKNNMLKNNVTKPNNKINNSKTKEQFDNYSSISFDGPVTPSKEEVVYEECLDDEIKAYPNTERVVNKYETRHLKDKEEIEKGTFVNKKYEDKVKEGLIKSLDSTVISPLTGKKYTRQEFSKNDEGINWELIAKTQKQASIDSSKSQMLLEGLTGVSMFDIKKTEVGSFFNPTKGLSYVYGTPNNNDKFKERMYISKMRNGETPVEKIRVAPGLGENYGNKGVGGFHQDIRNYVLPKTIDELRPLNNKQVTYKGRVISGKSINSLRKTLGKVSKNKPEPIHDVIENMPTKAEHTKQTQRLNFKAKYTNRQNSKYFIGSAKGDTEKHKTPINVKKSTKKVLRKFNITPANAKDQWKIENSNSDYGKKSFTAYPNERDITGKRTYTSNVKTDYLGMESSPMDPLKETRKQNFVGNNRPSGNFGSSLHKRHTVHDPNDVARTTIKQTTIDNKRAGNISHDGHGKHQHYEKDTMPKITLRNTLDNIDTNVNVSQHGTHKATSKPLDTMKTTVKETTNNCNYKGTAVSSNRSPMNNQYALNMRHNINKEQVAKGRTMTPKGPSQSISKDNITSSGIKKKVVKTPHIIEGNLPIQAPNKDSVNVRLQTPLGTLDRIQPYMINQLETNPYTHSVTDTINLNKPNISNSTNNNSSDKKILVNSLFEEKVRKELEQLHS